MNLTEKQIEDFKKLAQSKTTQEENADGWDPSYLSGGSYDHAYWMGYTDKEILNARFILDLVGIEH